MTLSKTGEKKTLTHHDILVHNVAIITPPHGLKDKLKKSIEENRPLTVKLGFDPTAPDLHIGHAVVLKKLRDFQESGHKVIVIIGDFTARIGDPTGRSTLRPPLSSEKIVENAKTYVDQLSKILDVSKITTLYNSEWLDKLNFTDVVKLMSKMTVAQIMQREDFSNRFQNNTPIGMHELTYPIMQGQDSVAINADIELGGTDQLFNCMVGRTLQEAENKDGQIVISMPLLVGLDGKEKMSKSKGNYIGLTDAPNDMYGKVMSIPDDLLINYLELASDFSSEKIEELKQAFSVGTLHPMTLKKTIAANIVKQYHGETASIEAERFFAAQFQSKADSEKIYAPVPRMLLKDLDTVSLIDVCLSVAPNVSKGEIKRLISAGAVSVNDKKIDDFTFHVPVKGNEVRLKFGKRGYFVFTDEEG